jgi:Putative auto-transporter adhesin, head GIN domain
VRAARVLLLASMSLVVAAASASCTGQRVRGSGRVVTKDVAVSSFTRLQVSWGFAVTVAVGQPSLKLRIDDNLDRYLDVGVDGDTLRIGLRRVSSVSDATLQATVTAPSLAQIRRTISASLSGGSPLRYRGSPTVTRQDVSGGSSITRVA